MILLDLDRLRHTEVLSRTAPEVVATLRWVVCPECLWLTYGHPRERSCGRAAGQQIFYGGGSTSITSPLCVPGSLVIVPEHLAAVLTSTYLLGGLNALATLTFSITPEALGLPSSLDKYRERHPKPCRSK